MTNKRAFSTEQTRIHYNEVGGRHLDIQKYGLCLFGTFEDRTHHFEKARILRLFQAALHAIFHDRDEFLVAQLIIVCEKQKSVEFSLKLT